MKSASISYTKNHLSSMIDAVKHGQCIIILDRNHPVAKLEPIRETTVHLSEQLSLLERKGILRCAHKKSLPKILTENPPKPKKGADILQALLSEREDNR